MEWTHGRELAGTEREKKDVLALIPAALLTRKTVLKIGDISVWGGWRGKILQKMFLQIGKETSLTEGPNKSCIAKTFTRSGAQTCSVTSEDTVTELQTMRAKHVVLLEGLKKRKK